MNIGISDRDKKLLLILAIFILLVGGYFLMGSITDSNKELENEKTTLSSKYSELMGYVSKKDTFIKDTQDNKDRYDEVMASYGSWISEAQTLVFLSTVEENTNVWLKQTGFSDISKLYDFGKITSSNPSKLGQSVYSSDYVGYTTQLSLAYECTYDELKTVLEYLRENGKKYTINTISLTYSEASDTVSGTMQVSAYAITGKDRPQDEPTIKDVPVGTGNIFASGTFSALGTDGSYKNQIVSNHDLYLIMNQVGSDMDTIVVGQSGDSANEKAISTNSTNIEDVTIKVTGTMGNYNVTYKIGDAVYPVEGAEQGAPIMVGDSLDLLIISQPRAGVNDSSAANVTLINETDMPLNIAVLNDDTENPRVKIVSSVGVIAFHEE